MLNAAIDYLHHSIDRTNDYLFSAVAFDVRDNRVESIFATSIRSRGWTILDWLK